MGPSPLQPPVPLLAPPTQGSPRNPVGARCKPVREGWGKREAEAFILPPGAHRGHRISVWENPSRLKASIRDCWVRPEPSVLAGHRLYFTTIVNKSNNQPTRV